MKASTVAEFACEFNESKLFVDPCHDDDRLRTMRGTDVYDYSLRQSLQEAIGPRELSEQIDFIDTTKPLNTERVLDRFHDATNGIDPGNPWIKGKVYDPDTPIEEVLGHNGNEVERRLDRFFAQTNTRPRIARPAQHETNTNDIQGKGSWGGSANKLSGNVLMPDKGACAKSFLHELGHCSMGLVSFTLETTTDIREDNINHHPVNRNFNISSGGLQFGTIEGETRGIILEESVAEALGALTNQKLGIVVQDGPEPNIPDKLKPYIINGNFSFSSPSAIALELIADEIGMPFEQYLKLWTDYANVGVHNMDARQEVAESIYRGTRGKLKMSQVEGLPYPTNPRASLAMLWAVESALEIPDHARYSQHFFYEYA